jgi:hypothetical protein
MVAEGRDGKTLALQLARGDLDNQGIAEPLGGDNSNFFHQ